MLNLTILNVSGRYNWNILNKAIPTWKHNQYERMKLSKGAVASAFGYFIAKVKAYELGKNRVITQEKNGKPKFEGDELFFNISHSKDKVICVVGDVPVGVDIERISEKLFYITDGFLSQREKKAFQNITEEEKAEFLCTIWTLKEAYGKWEGTGLSYPIKDVSFIKMGNSWRCYLEEINEYQSKCEILTYKQEKDFMFSVCAENCTDISIQHMTEEELLQKGKEMGLC